MSCDNYEIKTITKVLIKPHVRNIKNNQIQIIVFNKIKFQIVFTKAIILLIIST